MQIVNTTLLKLHNKMENNLHKGIGYSNGVAYPLLEIDIKNMQGLIELKEWIFPVWCAFEKIEIYGN